MFPLTDYFCWHDSRIVKKSLYINFGLSDELLFYMNASHSLKYRTVVILCMYVSQLLIHTVFRLCLVIHAVAVLTSLPL